MTEKLTDTTAISRRRKFLNFIDALSKYPPMTFQEYKIADGSHVIWFNPDLEHTYYTERAEKFLKRIKLRKAKLNEYVNKTEIRIDEGFQKIFNNDVIDELKMNYSDDVVYDLINYPKMKMSKIIDDILNQEKKEQSLTFHNYIQREKIIVYNGITARLLSGRRCYCINVDDISNIVALQVFANFEIFFSCSNLTKIYQYKKYFPRPNNSVEVLSTLMDNIIDCIL